MSGRRLSRSRSNPDLNTALRHKPVLPTPTVDGEQRV
jgi:hypothetical protein